MTQGPVAGWYPEGDGERYWDGEGWTDHRRSRAVAPAASPYAVPMASTSAGPSLAVAPKNPGLSLIVSFFLPGVGSMMNGDIGEGVGILIGYLVACLFSIILIGIPFAVGLWIWGMVDGYTGAQRWNLQHGILS